MHEHWSLGLHKLTETERPTLEPSASPHIFDDESFGLHEPTGWPTREPSATAHSSNSSHPSVAVFAVAPAPESPGAQGSRTRHPTPRPSSFPILSPTHMPLWTPTPSVAHLVLVDLRGGNAREASSFKVLRPVDSPSPSSQPTLIAMSSFLAMIAIYAALLLRKYHRRSKNSFDIERNVDVEAPVQMRTFTNNSGSFGESDSVELSDLG